MENEVNSYSGDPKVLLRLMAEGWLKVKSSKSMKHIDPAMVPVRSFELLGVKSDVTLRGSKGYIHSYDFWFELMEHSVNIPWIPQVITYTIYENPNDKEVLVVEFIREDHNPLFTEAIKYCGWI